jgi:hypothetical protein
MRKKLGLVVAVALVVAAVLFPGRSVAMAQADDRGNDKAVEAALGHLANPDPGARVAAADALLRLADHAFTARQVGALLDAWMLEPDLTVRERLGDVLARPGAADRPSREGTERGGLVSLPPAARVMVRELADRVRDPARFAARIPRKVRFEEVPVARPRITAFDSKETKKKKLEEWKKEMEKSGEHVEDGTVHTRKSLCLLVRYRAARALSTLGANAKDAVPALLAALNDEGQLEVPHHPRRVGLTFTSDEVKLLRMDDVAADTLARIAPDGAYMRQAEFKVYTARRAARLAEAERREQKYREEQRASQESLQVARTEVLKAGLAKAKSDEERARAIEAYDRWPIRLDALGHPEPSARPSASPPASFSKRRGRGARPVTRRRRSCGRGPACR